MILQLPLGIRLIKCWASDTQLLALCCILPGRLRWQCDIRLLGDLLQFGVRGAMIGDHALRELFDLRRRSALFGKLGSLNLGQATRCGLHRELAVSRTKRRRSREGAQTKHAGGKAGWQELMHSNTSENCAGSHIPPRISHCWTTAGAATVLAIERGGPRCLPGWEIRKAYQAALRRLVERPPPRSPPPSSSSPASASGMIAFCVTSVSLRSVCFSSSSVSVSSAATCFSPTAWANAMPVP